MGRVTQLAPVTEIPQNELRAFEADGNKIAVANVSGTFYAFGDTCTHKHCPLSKGELEGTTVTCPCHGSQFDVTTGAVLHGPAEDPVESYPVRVDGNTLVVEV
jgi:nitrite reductase/ring-hydroxylating ferredoxin subunit